MSTPYLNDVIDLKLATSTKTIPYKLSRCDLPVFESYFSWLSKLLAA